MNMWIDMQPPRCAGTGPPSPPESLPQGPSHVLSGIWLHGNEFVENVPELLDNLPSRLGLTRDDLDLSIQSLAKVDMRLQSLGPDACLAPELFDPLVAYLGEVIRKHLGGTWRLEFQPDYDIYEPWIVAASGERHTPFMILYEALCGDTDASKGEGGPCRWKQSLLANVARRDS
jgi:hypothetical protein